MAAIIWPIATIFLANFVCLSNGGLEGLNSFDQFEPERVTGETELFVGEKLNLTCRLKNQKLAKNLTADNIFFVKTTPKEAKNDVECVAKNLVHKAGPTTASLVVPNVTVNYTGTYECRADKLPCDIDPQAAELCGVSGDIKIEYPPQKVINFDCVLHNWDSWLECSWKHPVPYVNKSNIKTSVTYNADPNDNKVYHCPRLTSNQCIWNEFPGSEEINVEVSVTNKERNITTSAEFRCLVFQRVKPDPVENLNVEAADEGCLLLRWTHKQENRKKKFRIKHKSVRDSKFEIIQDNWNKTVFKTCGYGPMTGHNFSVECFPTGLYSGYWSTPIFKNFWTPQSAPSLGPEIVNGSFVSSECENNERTVTVFWQEVKDSAKNGIINKYLIRTMGSEISVINNEYKGSIKKVPCRTSTVVEIFSCNDGGLSVKPSVIVIPPLSFEVSQKVRESFVVEVESSRQLKNETKDILSFQWEQKSGRDLKNYTIFWCWRSPGTCGGKIYWLQARQSQVNQSLTHLISGASHYLYGISARDDVNGMASAIHWAPCLYSRDHTDLPVPPKFDVQPEPKAFTVTWERQLCTSKLQHRITGYKVKWCEVNDCKKDKIHSKEVPAKTSYLKFSGLQAGKEYNVTIQSISDGIAGKEVRPWETVIPGENNEASPWALVGILCLFLVLVLSVFCYCFQKCRHSKEKIENIAKGADQLSSPNPVLQIDAPVLPRFSPDFMPQQNSNSPDISHMHLSSEDGNANGSSPIQSLGDSVCDSSACLIPPTQPSGKRRVDLTQIVKYSSNSHPEPAVIIPSQTCLPPLSPSSGDRLLSQMIGRNLEETTAFSNVPRCRGDLNMQINSDKLISMDCFDVRETESSSDETHSNEFEESSHTDPESLKSYVMVSEANQVISGLPKLTQYIQYIQTVDPPSPSIIQ